jgi:phosphate starvation-inducible protein PhoH
MDYKLPQNLKNNFDGKKYESNFIYKNISISEIIKIETGDIEEVYNIEVEDNNNYFYNNILVHNCQNTSPQQIRMFLTRIGENCKIVMTGDPMQSDIRGINGLSDAVKRFNNIPDIGIVEFSDKDIVRHPIVALIEQKYKEDIKENCNNIKLIAK